MRELTAQAYDELDERLHSGWGKWSFDLERSVLRHQDAADYEIDVAGIDRGPGRIEIQNHEVARLAGTGRSRKFRQRRSFRAQSKAAAASMSVVRCHARIILGTQGW